MVSLLWNLGLMVVGVYKEDRVQDVTEIGNYLCVGFQVIFLVAN